MTLPPSAVIGWQRPAYLSLPNDRRGSAGEEAVELAALAGLVLDDWQAWLLRESLQVGGSGRWSAFEVGVVLPRQNGKGGLLEARQLFGLFLGGEVLAVHTAHEFKTCYEHFLRIKGLVENTPELDAKVDRIRTGAGDQAIELKNGNRLRFIARSAGSGRGMSGDTVYLDEAFALTPQIMGALLPTLSAVPNPQVWYTSSHPTWAQTVLYQLVQRGRAGGSERLLYADWGNEDTVSNDDRDAWLRANPALGIRINEAIIEAELAAMAGFPDEFRRERLGIIADASHITIIPVEKWRAACSSTVAPRDPLTFAVEVSPDREWAAIVAASSDADGAVVELIDYRPGVGWLGARCAQLASDHKARVVREARSPAAAVADLEADEITTGDAVKAAGAFYDAIADGRLRVRSDQRFDAALAAASRQPVGDAWRFGRKAGGDVCPLNAAVLAAFASGDSPVFQGGFTDLNDLFDDD